MTDMLNNQEAINNLRKESIELEQQVNYLFTASRTLGKKAGMIYTKTEELINAGNADAKLIAALKDREHAYRHAARLADLAIEQVAEYNDVLANGIEAAEQEGLDKEIDAVLDSLPEIEDEEAF